VMTAGVVWRWGDNVVGVSTTLRLVFANAIREILHFLRSS
jgi:hypothetical protein